VAAYTCTTILHRENPAIVLPTKATSVHLSHTNTREKMRRDRRNKAKLLSPKYLILGIAGSYFVLLFFFLGRHYSCMILSFQCCTSVSFRPDIFYTHFSSRLDSKYLHARLIHSSKPHLHTPLDYTYTSITHTTAAHSPHTRITHATAALTPHSQHSSHTHITHATAALSLHSYSQLQNEE